MIENGTLNKYIIITRNYNKIAFAPINEPEKYQIIDLDSDEEYDFDFEVYEKMDKYKFKQILDLYYSCSKNINDENTDCDILDTVIE